MQNQPGITHFISHTHTHAHDIAHSHSHRTSNLIDTGNGHTYRFELIYFDVLSIKCSLNAHPRFIIVLIYKAFWEWNSKDSAIETSYLFLYYDISVEFYDLSSPQLFKYFNNLFWEGSIFYNTLPSIPVQYKKKYCKHVFDFINKNYLFPTLLIWFFPDVIQWWLLFDIASILIYIKLDITCCAHESIYLVWSATCSTKKKHLQGSLCI